MNTSLDTTSYPSSSQEDEKNVGEENNNNQEIENRLEQCQRANLLTNIVTDANLEGRCTKRRNSCKNIREC
jgi:hypothetical protein